MRISDWSSDVCSSDLAMAAITGEVDCSALPLANPITLGDQAIVLGIFADTNPTPDDTGNAPVVTDVFGTDLPPLTSSRAWAIHAAAIARTSVVSGKSVSVRVNPGVRRIIKIKQ